MKALGLALSLLVSSVSFADVQAEVDSFGGNEALYIKAKALNPEIENEVVQNRFMVRDNRFEIAPEMSGVFGGDAYNRTNNAGINLHYHITPKWSVGVKYNYAFNQLTPEGEAMINRATDESVNNPTDPQYLYPQVIFPKSEALVLANWYPMVGKLSFGKLGVAHFDTYLLAGYGQMELSNGTSAVTTAGIGLGFWINKNLTTRIEYRAQSFTAEYYDKSENMLTSVASVQMGWML